MAVTTLWRYGTWMLSLAAVMAAAAMAAAVAAQIPRPPQTTVPALRPFRSTLTWSQSAPKVVVMVHGYTEDPATKKSGEARPGQLEYTKHYWGFQLCSELLDAFTLQSFATTPPTGLGVQTPQTNQALHSLSGRNMLTAWETAAVNENVAGDYFYVKGRPPAGDPPLALMMSGRDASGRIIPQARQLIDQLYEKINAQYRGVKPNLIFVCHSMGGLTMRYILTSPNDPIDGASLSARQKERAAWLRDRTLYVTTLATPHEGSPLPAKMQNVRQFLREKSSFLTPALKLIGLKNPDPVGIVTNTLGVTPALDHLRQDFCTAMNQGQLAPHKMTRSDGSLIPVYTMGGRTPGGSFFNDADQYPTGGIEIEADMERELKAIGLMMLDWSVHNVPSGARSWGSAINVPGMDLDDCERGNKRLGLTYVSPPSKIPAAGLEGLPLFYLRNKNDGEFDTDGMVGIQSALGIRLGTSLNLYFDHRQSWNVDGRRMDGSWYRVPTGPWDRTNHDTICNRMGIGRWLRENIILRAGPLPARTGSTSVWPAGS